jgi:hypothetical protein
VRRLPGQGVAADAAVVVGGYLVLGIVCGGLWWLLAAPAEYVVTGDGGTMGELELSRRFAVDGWYAVIAAVAGFLSGAGLAWWRSRDPLFTTLLLVPGAALAAAAMSVVGGVLGPGDPDAALEAASRGDTVPVALSVTVTASYLVWPIAILLGALMVLWSSTGPGTGGADDTGAADPAAVRRGGDTDDTDDRGVPRQPAAESVGPERAPR